MLQYLPSENARFSGMDVLFGTFGQVQASRKKTSFPGHPVTCKLTSHFVSCCPTGFPHVCGKIDHRQRTCLQLFSDADERVNLCGSRGPPRPTTRLRRWRSDCWPHPSRPQYGSTGAAALKYNLTRPVSPRIHSRPHIRATHATHNASNEQEAQERTARCDALIGPEASGCSSLKLRRPRPQRVWLPSNLSRDHLRNTSCVRCGKQTEGLTLGARCRSKF